MDMLSNDASVVFDFAGNTVAERTWVRSLFEAANASHTLHFLDVPEEECLRRLSLRNQTKPEGLYFATTSKDEFRAISQWFQPPQANEGFNMIRHES